MLATATMVRTRSHPRRFPYPDCRHARYASCDVSAYVDHPSPSVRRRLSAPPWPAIPARGGARPPARPRPPLPPPGAGDPPAGTGWL